MTRKRKTSQEARELILKEARELFFEKGYVHTTMETLRQRCDMSKGNLYYHFQTKEDIFLQVLFRHSEMIMEDFRLRTKDLDSCYDKLMVIAEIWGEDCKNPLMQYLDEISANLKIDETQLNLLYEELNRFRKEVTLIVKEGIKKGEFKKGNVENISFCISTMMDGTAISCMWLPEVGENDYVKIHKENMRILLNGIKEG